TLTAGTAQLPLTFAGADIGAGVADGPYRLTDLQFTRILSDELLLDSVPVAYTTAPYSRYDWPRPNVALGGVPSDQGIDTNANGYYDYLQVTLPLDVKSAGVYSGSVSLLTSGGGIVGTGAFTATTFV